jgi:phosphonate transport system permease protein
MNNALEMRAPTGSPGARTAWTVCVVVVILALFVQAWIVVQARPQDLVTGAHGMADIISRAMPPAFDQFVPGRCSRRSIWRFSALCLEC